VKHIKVIITGKVQGVYFRETARQEALKLGISGLVRNEPDGTVYIEAEGENEAVNTFIRWCHVGPPGAVIESVSVSEQPAGGYTDFKIS
jgi:acylphosphatase